jgi:hypothetical protein
MLKKIIAMAILVSGIFASGPRAAAQGPSGAGSGSQQPLPPAPPANVGGSDTVAKPAATGGPVTPEEIVVPDSLPLSGAQNLTLGSTLSSHNFLLPSFGVIVQGQINPYNTSGTAGNSSLIGSTYLTGRLALNRTSGQSQLTLDYLAGGSFSSDSSQGNSGIQSLNFSDSHQWGRWSFLVGDHLSYTAQSPFGFGGIGGLGNFGVGLGNLGGSSPGFQPGFLPNQSIFIDGTPQISNGAVGEVDYKFSPRASFTFAGSYGLLDFIGNGFQNTSSGTFQSGYNYLLDRSNSVGVFYRFSDIMFGPAYQAIQGIKDHSVQATYARRLVGRLSLQVGAGPDFRIFRAPLAGPSTEISWAAMVSLTYAHRYLSTGFTYSHSLTGGSGTFLGATTDLFTGDLNRSFGRNWDGGLSAGYSRNQALQQTTAAASGLAPQAWFTSLHASRHFVRYGSLFISANVSGQSNLAAVCTLAACNVNSLSTSISLGYNWGLRPIVLD